MARWHCHRSCRPSVRGHPGGRRRGQGLRDPSIWGRSNGGAMPGNVGWSGWLRVRQKRCRGRGRWCGRPSRWRDDLGGWGGGLRARRCPRCTRGRRWRPRITRGRTRGQRWRLGLGDPSIWGRSNHGAIPGNVGWSGWSGWLRLGRWRRRGLWCGRPSRGRLPRMVRGHVPRMARGRRCQRRRLGFGRGRRVRMRSGLRRPSRSVCGHRVTRRRWAARSRPILAGVVCRAHRFSALGRPGFRPDDNGRGRKATTVPRNSRRLARIAITTMIAPTPTSGTGFEPVNASREPP